MVWPKKRESSSNLGTTVFKVKELSDRSVEWLCKHQDQIDANPIYQRRGKVWSGKDKAFLIDSILNGYDIPKMYLANFTSAKSPLNKKKKRYAVIDGKQRLEAVTEFFDGKLALNKTFLYDADPSLELRGPDPFRAPLLPAEVVGRLHPRRQRTNGAILHAHRDPGAC